MFFGYHKGKLTVTGLPFCNFVRNTISVYKIEIVGPAMLASYLYYRIEKMFEN